MKTLLGKKVTICNFLTTDPFDKRGQDGKVIKVVVIDEDNADVSIVFEDGIVGLYELGTFEIN